MRITMCLMSLRLALVAAAVTLSSSLACSSETLPGTLPGRIRLAAAAPMAAAAPPTTKARRVVPGCPALACRYRSRAHPSSGWQSVDDALRLLAVHRA